MNESFNFLLLSTFYQIERVEQDIQTLLKRFRALLIIYTNLSLIFVMVLRNLSNIIGLAIPAKEVNLILFSCPMLSLFFLKRKNQKIATALVLLCAHLGIFQINRASQGSLVSMTALLGVSAYVFFVTPNRIFQFMNLLLCVIQNIIIIRDLSEVFKVTFTEEQAQKIFQMQLASFLYIILFAAVSFIQRNIHENLLQLIQSNSNRTEKISQELMQAIKAKDTFVSSLSHEIRNPLNAMKGSIDYLMKSVTNHTHLQILENAHLSSEVLLQLLNNVLDAAKLRSDKMELLYSENNITDIIKKVLATQTDRIKEKGISAYVQVDKKIPKRIWIDSSRLLQIIMNLVSNTLKFTQEGGRLRLYACWCRPYETKEKLLSPFNNFSSNQMPDQEQNNHITSDYSRSPDDLTPLKKKNNISIDSIMSQAPLEYSHINHYPPSSNMQDRFFKPKSIKEIIPRKNKNDPQQTLSGRNDARSPELEAIFSPETARRDAKNKGFLKIQVTDNGPGIPEEVVPRLFTMFFQGSNDVASIHGGSGLGLWICKQLCQKMGGDIAVYSKVGQGTTFVFYVSIENSNIDLNNSLSFQIQSTKKKNVRALVVDDYQYNRDIHKLLLEREGVRVSTACHGKEAFEKYIMEGDGYYDFILMDIQMPEMDGFTAFRKIKEWENKKGWKEVQVYFVSGNYYSDQDLLAELKTYGQLSDFSEIKCLRKPIDVSAVMKIVEGFTN